MDINMKIRPFKEHQDTLFTDYAMQIFNAHASEDSQETLELLMDSYRNETINNPAFLPGVIFGSIIHMYMMMQMISEINDEDLDESIRNYNELYNAHRKQLAKMLGNRPEYAEEMIKILMEEFGIEDLN